MSGKGSSVKRHRQNLKRRLSNKMIRSRVRSSTRKFLQLVEDKSMEDARKEFDSVASLLDKATASGVIHKNSAARKKQRLHKALATLGKPS